MKTAVIVIIFVFILIIAGGIGLYFYFEIPAQNTEALFNTVNLRAFDSETGDQIRVDYLITITPAHTPYIRGTTLSENYVQEKLPLNNSFSVFTVNREGQEYYTSFEEFSNPNPIIINANSTKDFRIDFEMFEGGDLIVESLSEWPNNNPYALKLTSKGKIKNLGFCVRWSTHLLGVYNDDYVSEPMPTRLENLYDRCWNMNTDLKEGEEIILNLRFSKFGEIDESDYIKLVFLDGDISQSNPLTVLREDLNGNDLGIEDIVYVIE